MAAPTGGRGPPREVRQRAQRPHSPTSNVRSSLSPTLQLPLYLQPDADPTPPPPSCRAAATAANHATAGDDGDGAGPSTARRPAVLLRPVAFDVVAARVVGREVRVCLGARELLPFSTLWFSHHPLSFPPTSHTPQTEYQVRFTEPGLGDDDPPQWFPAAALMADPAGAAAVASFQAAPGGRAPASLPPGLTPMTRRVGERAPPPPPRTGRLALAPPAAGPRPFPAIGFSGVIRPEAVPHYDWDGFVPLTRPVAPRVVVVDAGGSGGVTDGSDGGPRRLAGVPAALWTAGGDDEAAPSAGGDQQQADAGEQEAEEAAAFDLPLTQLPPDALPPFPLPPAPPPPPPAIMPRARSRKPPPGRVARSQPVEGARVRFAPTPVRSGDSDRGSE